MSVALGPIGDAPIGDAPIGDAPIGGGPIGGGPIGDGPIGDVPIPTVLGLRSAVVSAVPDERHRATPQYLLLDLAGATLVAGFAFTQWPQFWPEEWGGDRERAFKGRKMEGVCIGLRSGSSALDANGETRASDNTPAVAPLRGPADQRSGTFELVSIEMLPRGLPFGECPGAVTKIGQLVGQPLGDLRDEVLARLKNTEGCTHLNDELRALADVPALVARLLETA